MNNLLTYFIEANLYLVCFYLLYQILLVRDKHFRFNRAFLLLGILFSLSLPLLSIDLSSGNTLEGYIVLPVVTITEAQTESVGFIIEWWHIIGFIYIIGLVFYMTRLFWQMAVIVRKLPILNSSREKKDGYTLVTTNGEIPTCSFFKYLFWDKTTNLSKEEQKQVFEHELAHIRQWHSVDVLLVEILRAIFWFNPAIHMIKSRITEVHEYQADHQVTKQIGVEDYSKLLTLQVFKNFDFALSNNFHKNQVVKRIRMLKTDHSKSIWLNVMVLVPVIAMLVGLFAFNIKDLNETGNDLRTEGNEFQPTDIAQPNEQAPATYEKININGKEIFTKVENQPAPSSGMNEFYHYIQQNLKYQDAAKEMGIEGKVFVQFIVESTGKLTSVQAVKGIGYGCDEEAVRVIESSPDWNPGKHNGQAVNVIMILPITFKLN
jgi:TonB family protein